MKEHIARWRKCEETLAKLLKEGKDTGDFAIEEKGKGEVWKKERKDVNQKKKDQEGGSITMVSNMHLQNPLTLEKGWPQEQIGHQFDLKKKEKKKKQELLGRKTKGDKNGC